MEKWVFLGKEWDRFSPLRQFALVSADKKQCVWFSGVSLLQYLGVLARLFLTRVRTIGSKNTTSSHSALSKGFIPFPLTCFILRKWFSPESEKEITFVVTDNPRFALLIDALGAKFSWVYMRPVCYRCEQRHDASFVEHDELMVKKAMLVINDNQLNEISEKVLNLSEQERKVYSMPTPPLIPEKIKKVSTSERVVGFYGAMDDQVDIDLISQSAMALPSWTFELHVIWGRVPDVLLDLPNVNVKKAATTDLGFFTHWDVALLPYSCAFHRYCYNPPMLIDYIRHGLPVASTALPVMTHFASFVTQQRPKETFANTLRQALSQKVNSHSQCVDFVRWWGRVIQQVDEKIRR